MATYNYTPAPKASLFKGRFGGIVCIGAKRFEIGRNSATDECLTIQH